MIADLFEIKAKGIHEKGLFATRFIPKGTILIFPCKKCGTYSKGDLAKLPKKELEFVLHHEVMDEHGLMSKYCDKRLLYINHSCNAHILETDKGFDIAVRDIKKGEEATEDYRVFEEEGFHFVGGCKCGERNCMKNTAFRPPAPKKLQGIWERRINAAVRLVGSVKQPLRTRLLREHPRLDYLFKNAKGLSRESNPD
ncbi:MAG TPA: SET domain-containing protein [Candidatus Acidoferrales bacterium]|nr:SET domain-containing protein [Candidatus Acidoferrales bacterium]